MLFGKRKQMVSV